MPTASRLVTWGHARAPDERHRSRPIESCPRSSEKIAGRMPPIKGAVVTRARDVRAGADLHAARYASRATFKDLATKGRRSAATVLFADSPQASRSSTGASRPAAAVPSAAHQTHGAGPAASSSSGLPSAHRRRQRQELVSARRGSRSGCSPAPAAPAVIARMMRRPTRCNSCSRATSSISPALKTINSSKRGRAGGRSHAKRPKTGQGK